VAEPVVDSVWDAAEIVVPEIVDPGIVAPESFPDGDVGAGDALSTEREAAEPDWVGGAGAATGAGAGDRLEAAADCGAAVGSR